MWNRINFLWKSKNHHSVHSPFVFQYITKGIYQNKKKYRGIKPGEKWLKCTMEYFRPQKIYCDDDLLFVKLKSFEYQNDIQADVYIYRIKTSENRKDIKEKIKQINENQYILLVNEIYPNELLKELRQDESVTLVIDFFYGVLISKRKEQLKQNFYIRI